MSTPTPFLLFLRINTICFLLFLLAAPILAANPLDIVINEIAWMGTNNSPRDEWIELYNNSFSPININGWKLKSDDGTPEITLEGKIPAKGFFLLERTDETTLIDIKSDLIYKGNLNNNGEHLKLFDSKEKIIDEIDCSDDWFRGDNKTKRTMERKDALTSGNNPENWQNSQDTGGTPKSKNSPGEKIKELDSLLSEEEIQVKETRNKEELAMINKQVPKSWNPFFTFLIAIFIAVSSGFFVLFLKRKQKERIKN
jgi:hypothetical protein